MILIGTPCLLQSFAEGHFVWFFMSWAIVIGGVSMFCSHACGYKCGLWLYRVSSFWIKLDIII